MLTGGPLGMARYRATSIRVTAEESDFLFVMAGVTESIMREREEARRKDAERHSGR